MFKKEKFLWIRFWTCGVLWIAMGMTGILCAQTPEEQVGYPWNKTPELFESTGTSGTSGTTTSGVPVEEIPECPPSVTASLMQDLDADRASYGGSQTTAAYEGAAGIQGLSATELKFTQWDHRFMPGRGRALPTNDSQTWTWQSMPQGILYHAYLADGKESRLSGEIPYEFKDKEWYWNPTLGGRFGVVRYGNQSILYPEGFQIDMEASVIARMALKHRWDMWGSDYRVGVPFTYRKGSWEGRFGYYHISSHRGDEWMVQHYDDTKNESGRGLVERRNYVRDCLEFGIGYRPDANWRFFGGMDYAFKARDGADRWQFKLGTEYSPILLPNPKGSPFLALFLRWSQETDYATNFFLQGGWQWRTLYQHLLRLGMFYSNAYGNQYQFYQQHEKQLGVGLWFDF